MLVNGEFHTKKLLIFRYQITLSNLYCNKPTNMDLFGNCSGKKTLSVDDSLENLQQIEDLCKRRQQHLVASMGQIQLVSRYEVLKFFLHYFTYFKQYSPNYIILPKKPRASKLKAFRKFKFMYMESNYVF